MRSPSSSYRLIGRERERSLIRTLVEKAAAGTGATLLIEGEAGIGKSRLVRDLVERAAERGITGLSGEAHPLEGTMPFGPVAQALDLHVNSPDPRRAAIGRLLRGDMGHLRPATTAVDSRYRIVEEVLDLLESTCAQAPTALILEDVHWADESSLLCLSSLVHRLSHVPLLLVGTLRPTPATHCSGCSWRRPGPRVLPCCGWHPWPGARWTSWSKPSWGCRRAPCSPRSSPRQPATPSWSSSFSGP